MKKKLLIKFVDFWTNWNTTDDNHFYDLLSEKYIVELSEDPDIIFYSNFGKEHLKYKCTRIFFSTENVRPDFSICDFAICFDHSKNENLLRFPLWASYYITYEKKRLTKIYTTIDPESRFEEWSNRKKFCCLIVSNGAASERIDFYKMLDSKIKVDSAGRWNNTIGTELLAGTENKFEFIKDYRFVIAFENSSYSGYTTEKILEPLLAGCIPIYWGDPEVSKDFNPARFITVKNREDFEEVINRIAGIEKNKSLAKAYLNEKIFANDHLPEYLDKDYISKTLFSWVDKAREKKFKGVGAKLNSRLKYYKTVASSILYKFKNKLSLFKVNNKNLFAF